MTFRLTSGSGPVYISGTHATECNVQPDEDEDEDGMLEPEDEDELDEEDDQEDAKGPVRSNGKTAAA